MEALWEGNGMLENVGECWRRIRRKFYVTTSVDVEQTFCQGQLLLSHICNWLSVQSMQALLCLGIWSSMDYVKDRDLKVATILPGAESDDKELASNWDAI